NAFRYRVHGGGTWSKQYQITLVERPAIVTYHTVLHYPPYMGLDEPRQGPPQTLDVTGPEASQVEVVVQAEGNVAEAEIQMLAFRARPASSMNQVGDSGERIWFEDKLPAGATADGTWQWD